MTAQAHYEPSQASAPPSEKALMNMLGYMEDLTSLYSEELSALEIRDMRRFAELQPAKDRLVMSCEATMSELQKNPAVLKMVSPALKERVATAENLLAQMTKKSQHVCKIRAESARRVQQRLLDAACHLMTRDQARYNSNGQSSMGHTKPVATAINEAI